MPVTWVLESNVFSERCFEEMVSHLKARNFPLHILRMIPFSHELVGATPVIDGPCVVYGSLGVQKLSAAQGWTPGVWTSDAFTSTNYAARLGDLFLNHELLECRFSDVPKRVRALDWETFFIKPDSDGKAFAGAIVDRAEIDLWVDNLRTADLLAENDFDVVLAKPQALGREWRTVVVGGQVVAFSLYKQYQRAWAERSIDPEALATVERAARLFAPADVFVADVCETNDGMRIIEYNTFNSAGLYACDTCAVIDAISAFVEAGR